MDIKDVEKLALLARLELSVVEEKQILSDMEGILKYVKQIEEIEIEDVKPDYKLYNVWRDDIVENRDFSLDLMKEQFPDSQDGFLKVKKIL
jgi:aspartyl-tRNA(Asn)/glutamyl-tRNA(Gln) amidotransferase subunit C